MNHASIGLGIQDSPLVPRPYVSRQEMFRTLRPVGPHEVPSILHKHVRRAEADATGAAERNQLNGLTGKEWIQETKSVWRQKGLGANHEHTAIERLHPAPFSFQDVARLIRFFTKPGGLIFDPFVGVGSSLKAAALEGRAGLGVELSTRWAELACERLDVEVPGHSDQVVWRTDIRDALPRIPDEVFDFAVTSPPYWNILNKKADHKVQRERLNYGLDTNYSNDKRDLGNIEEYEAFVGDVATIFNGVARKIRIGRYLAIIVSDFRHKDRFYTLHSDLCAALDSSLLSLQGIIVLEQSNKALFPYGYPFAFVPNVHHQYILVLRRPVVRRVRVPHNVSGAI